MKTTGDSQPTLKPDSLSKKISDVVFAAGIATVGVGIGHEVADRTIDDAAQHPDHGITQTENSLSPEDYYSMGAMLLVVGTVGRLAAAGASRRQVAEQQQAMTQPTDIPRL